MELKQSSEMKRSKFLCSFGLLGRHKYIQTSSSAADDSLLHRIGFPAARTSTKDHVSRLNGTRRIQHTIIVDRLFHHPHRLVLILSKFWVDRLEYSRSQLSRHFLPSALSSVCDRFQATFQVLMIKGNERKKNRSGIASKQRSKDS